MFSCKIIVALCLATENAEKSKHRIDRDNYELANVVLELNGVLVHPGNDLPAIMEHARGIARFPGPVRDAMFPHAGCARRSSRGTAPELIMVPPV